MNKSDIYVVQLVDGLPSQIGEQKVRYRTVRLRETTVADEFAAVELAERVVSIQGKSTLLVSDELYRVAMTLRHVERFECAGLDPIDRSCSRWICSAACRPLIWRRSKNDACWSTRLRSFVTGSSRRPTSTRFSPARRNNPACEPRARLKQWETLARQLSLALPCSLTSVRSMPLSQLMAQAAELDRAHKARQEQMRKRR